MNSEKTTPTAPRACDGSPAANDQKPSNAGTLFFEYSGPIHSRPCGRGTVLDDLGDYFDDDGVLPSGDYVAEIRVWKRSDVTHD
jgi:hypothetical protein